MDVERDCYETYALHLTATMRDGQQLSALFMDWSPWIEKACLSLVVDRGAYGLPYLMQVAMDAGLDVTNPEGLKPYVVAAYDISVKVKAVVDLTDEQIFETLSRMVENHTKLEAMGRSKRRAA